MTQRWAIICGLIRDEQVFETQLQSMLAWKAAGEIEDIVLSTWFGELERYPSVKAAHARGEFILVQSDPPILKTVGYTIHQAKSLYYALQAVPPGAMVLKIRPDIAPVNEAVRAAVVSADLTLTPQPGWPEIFRKKILSAGYFADSPFYINDIIYYGQREDLLRLANFDLGTEFKLANTAAEQFFFRGAFAGACPLIEAYLQIYPPFPFGDRASAEARIDALLASDVFLDALAVSTRFMHHYFRVGFLDETARGQQEPLAENFNLGEMLAPEGAIPGVSYNPAAFAGTIVEERVIDGILQRRFARDALGERMAAALDRTEDPRYWQTFPDNPLHPHLSIRHLQQNLKAAFSETGFDYADRLAVKDGDDGRSFSVRGPGARISLTIENDETRQLADEINIMRRQLDDLRERGRHPA